MDWVIGIVREYWPWLTWGITAVLIPFLGFHFYHLRSIRLLHDSLCYDMSRLTSWLQTGELFWECFWAARAEKEKLITIVRVRIECELLDPPPRRPFLTASKSDWEEYDSERKSHKGRIKNRMGYALQHPESDSPVLSRVTVFALRDAERTIQNYFAAMRKLSIVDRDNGYRFLCLLKIEDGFIAPLHLLTGLLSRFGEDWEPPLLEYSDAIRDPFIIDPQLRRMQAFLFDCWMMWGPSIPVCQCPQWGTRPAYQLGYGDENNSVPLYSLDCDLGGLFSQSDGQPESVSIEDLGRVASAKRPLALPAVVESVLRAGRDLRKDGRFGAAQSSVYEDNLVLECKKIIEPGSRKLYQAYLWVMFVLCDETGEPLFRESKRWHGLLPFFSHGNIADGSTQVFLKLDLAMRALTLIEQFAGRAGKLKFQFTCAVDESACGESLRFADNPTIRDIMLLLLQSGKFPNLDASERLLLDPRSDDPFLELYSACHLPERIEEFFQHAEKYVKKSRRAGIADESLNQPESEKAQVSTPRALESV